MLRDYQNDALASIRKEYEAGIRRMIVVMPTGSGKTQVFSHLPEFMKEKTPGQTLVLAHRSELLDQSIEKLRAANPYLKVSKEMAEDVADTNSDIIVASTATLGRKGTKRTERFNWEAVDKVITDECHHSTSQSYANIYDLAKLSAPGTHKLHVGFTATPQRGDGQGLLTVYERVAYVYTLRQGITDGWLADLRGFRVKTDTSLEDIKIVAGDFAQGELADRVNNPQRNERIVKAWLKLGEDRKTLVFAADIKHAQDLATAFCDNDIMSRAVWGDDPNRALKLGAHRAGKIKVLVNVAIALEGYDDPSIACVVLAKPTKSGVVFTQAVGRGTRIFEGKTDCIVIDVVDNTSRHSLVTLPTLMGLSGGLDLRGQSLVYAVQKIEEMQEKYPSADFTKLESLTNLNQFIEQINMFEIRFPAEVETNSELTWYRSASGGFRINIPKDLGAGSGGHCSIFQNMLDQWEIDGKINGKTFHGTGSQMEKAFQVCDSQIRKLAPGVLRILAREATWHGKPAKDSQLTLLKRLFPWKTWPDNLTRGQASRIIGERLAKKAER